MQYSGNELADVFDTGMVLEGYINIYKVTEDMQYLEAAKRAGNFLIKNQEPDGSWTKYSYKNIPHSYHTLIAQAILKLYIILKEDKYIKSVESLLQWVVSVKKNNGWFEYQAFTAEEEPYTHTMAYFMQGLLEIYKLNQFCGNRFAYVLDIIKAYCDKLIQSFNLTNRGENIYILPGQVNSKWESAADYICITGNAQFSIVFNELFCITKNREYKKVADILLNIVNKFQIITRADTPFSGAISGSYPIKGQYHSYEFPNWASKFYADALMLNNELNVS